MSGTRQVLGYGRAWEEVESSRTGSIRRIRMFPKRQGLSQRSVTHVPVSDPTDEWMEFRPLSELLKELPPRPPEIKRGPLLPECGEPYLEMAHYLFSPITKSPEYYYEPYEGGP